MSETPLYTRLAAAYVRGALSEHRVPPEDDALFGTPLDELGEAELEALVSLGRTRGLRLHRFKRTMGLPRVRAVLGALRGIAPADLLDLGSGRGAFLWPLLDAMPLLPVTAVDILDHRVTDIRRVAEGGVTTLTAARADATDLPFPDHSFDVVTMLEVLEHLPATATALREATRVARRFLIISVPSRPDDNPEHVHLFTEGRLVDLLSAHGAARVAVDQVPGHLIALAKVPA